MKLKVKPLTTLKVTLKRPLNSLRILILKGRSLMARLRTVLKKLKAWPFVSALLPRPLVIPRRPFVISSSLKALQSLNGLWLAAPLKALRRRGDPRIQAWPFVSALLPRPLSSRTRSGIQAWPFVSRLTPLKSSKLLYTPLKSLKKRYRVLSLKARPSLQSRKAWPFVLLALLTLAYLLLRSPSITSASWFNDAGVYPERSRGTFRQKFTFGNSEEALKIELNLITLSWVVSKVGYLALTYDSLALRS